MAGIASTLALAAACSPAPTASAAGPPPAAPAGQPSTAVLAGVDVSGAWTTRWGGAEVCHLRLRQDGASVSGSYTTSGAPPGNVSGRLDGNVLAGTWSDEGGGGGGMRLEFSPDGRTFTGTWGSGSSSTNGGSWTGNR